MNLFLIFICVTTGLSGFLFGYDTAIISGAILHLKNDFRLNEYEIAWLVSCILIGCGAGALVAGFLADKYGRKTVLLVCALFFIISGIGMSIANSYNQFIFFRIICGVGIGISSMITPLYIAEIAPSKTRGRLVAIYQLTIVLGILCAYLFNYILVVTDMSSWRWMFGSQFFPSLVFLILVIFIPESPRWQVKMGLYEFANYTLNKLYLSAELRDIRNEIVQSNSLKHNRVQIKEVFYKPYWPIIKMGCIIAVFQQITGINALLYYAPMIFKSTGVSREGTLISTVLIGCVMLLFTFVSLNTIELLGRKKLLFLGAIFMGFSLFGVSICFYFKYYQNYAVLILFMIYIAAFSISLGSVTWVLLSELFPMYIKSLALSVCTFLLWISDFFTSYLFPILNMELGSAITTLVFACLCLFYCYYIYRIIPETKGKSLELIEKELLLKYSS